MLKHYKAPDPRPCFCCGKTTYYRMSLIVKPHKYKPTTKQIAVCSHKCELAIREIEPQINFAILKKIGRLRKHTRKRLRKNPHLMKDIPQLDLVKLLLRFDTCEYCDKPISSGDATFDHIEPLSTGGLHELSNIAIACSRCNSLKGSSLTEIITHGHSLNYGYIYQQKQKEKLEASPA